MKNMPLIEPIIGYLQRFLNAFFELLSLVLFYAPKQIIFCYFQHKRGRRFFEYVLINGNILQ